MDGKKVKPMDKITYNVDAKLLINLYTIFQQSIFEKHISLKNFMFSIAFLYDCWTIYLKQWPRK